MPEKTVLNATTAEILDVMAVLIMAFSEGMPTEKIDRIYAEVQRLAGEMQAEGFHHRANVATALAGTMYLPKRGEGRQ